MQEHKTKSLKDLPRYNFSPQPGFSGVGAIIKQENGCYIDIRNVKDFIHNKIKDVDNKIDKIIEEKKDFAERFGAEFETLVFYTDTKLYHLRIRRKELSNLLDNGGL